MMPYACDWCGATIDPQTSQPDYFLISYPPQYRQIVRHYACDRVAMFLARRLMGNAL